jgi:hypothetical protein
MIRSGAGKTTRRVILDASTSGTAFVDGHRYQDTVRPLHRVGSLLDANASHPGHSAWWDVLSITESNGIGRHRMSEAPELNGVPDAARRRGQGILVRDAPAPRHSGGPSRGSSVADLSTSRPTAATPKASTGSASRSRGWRSKATKSSSPVT